MIERILNLECVENLSVREFERLQGVLTTIGFFSKDESPQKPKFYDKIVYTVLKKSPDESDRLDGQDYIRKDNIDNQKIHPVSACTYNFEGRVISTCGWLILKL